MANKMNPELPRWPGASKCYSRAYRLLELLAENAPRVCWVSVPLSRPHYPCDRESYIVRTNDMDEIIEALNAGDEERIKFLLLRHNAVERLAKAGKA